MEMAVKVEAALMWWRCTHLVEVALMLIGLVAQTEGEGLNSPL